MVFGMLVIQQGGGIVRTNAGFRRQLFSEKKFIKIAGQIQSVSQNCSW